MNVLFLLLCIVAGLGLIVALSHLDGWISLVVELAFTAWAAVSYRRERNEPAVPDDRAPLLKALDIAAVLAVPVAIYLGLRLLGLLGT